MPYLGDIDPIPYLAVLIVRRGLVDHWGIYVGGGSVFHCIPVEGEVLTTFEDFCGGTQPTIRPTEPASAGDITARINARLRNPRQYDLFANNCEQVVREIATGKHESRQLVGWTIGTILVGLSFYALSQPGNRRASRYN